MLLVCRFHVKPDDRDAAAGFAARARRALELLGAADGYLGGEAGRAVDDPAYWVLTVRFRSVDAYRRALSPFDVREHVIPLLSEADTAGPGTYETLLDRPPGGPTGTYPSLRDD